MRTIDYLLVLVFVFGCDSMLHATLKGFEDSEVSEVSFTLDDIDTYDALRAQSVTPLLHGAVNKKTYGSVDENYYTPISRSSSFDTVVSSADTVTFFCVKDLHARQIAQVDQKLSMLPVKMSPVVNQAEESDSCIQTLSRGVICLLGLCCKK